MFRCLCAQFERRRADTAQAGEDHVEFGPIGTGGDVGGPPADDELRFVRKRTEEATVEQKWLGQVQHVGLELIDLGPGLRTGQPV